MVKQVSIGEVFEFVRNGASIKQEDNKSGYPITRIETIWNETIDDSRFGYADIFDNELIKHEKYLLEIGDILMTHINSPKHLGKSAMYNGLPEKLIHGMNLLCLRPDKKISDSKYLKHYLNSSYFKELLPKISNQSVNQASFSAGNLKTLEIPLPPLPQQKKIANILDAADALRQNDKALIAKYDELTQALFLDMFGDFKGKKEQLSLFCELNPKKSEIANVDRNTLISFLPMNKVSSKGAINLSEIRTIDEVWNGFTYFRELDVVFAKITPCMENGKGAILRNLKNKLGFGTTEFHVLRPKKDVSTSEWLYYLTMMKDFRETAEKNMTGSAGQKRVPIDFLKNYKIFCPPIDLQNQFAERIAIIEEQKAIAQKSLEKSESLFSSLLQKAFKGELT